MFFFDTMYLIFYIIVTHSQISLSCAKFYFHDNLWYLLRFERFVLKGQLSAVMESNFGINFLKKKRYARTRKTY